MGDHGHAHAGGKTHEEEDDRKKIVSFWTIGILTFGYCIVELVAGVYLGSLTLLSDAFHNLSDVASLYVAYWALKAARRDSGDEMTYGWARTELIGGLINGCALLSLCVYIVLEAIPRYICATGIESCGDDHPSLDQHTYALIFVYVAAGGLAVNTLGTVMFAVTGHGHTHAGGGHHGHSHGGDDHGHAHGEKKKKKHGHGHSHGDKKKKTPEAERLLDDDHDDHGHSHAHGEKKEKKHGHGHAHGEKKKEKVSGFAIGMSVDDATELGSLRAITGGSVDLEAGHGHDHGHSHGEKKKKHGHGHGHGEKKEKKEKKEKGMDMNIKAVFLHYLGDMLSSAFVLVTGLLLLFLGNDPVKFPNAAAILAYVDPTASLLIVGLILISTIPLVKRCATILLQSTPNDIDMKALRNRLHQVEGVHGVHDLHVWQLVDGLAISSVHIVCDHRTDFNDLQKKVKKVFHKLGVHSTAVQPEFVDTSEHPKRDYCEVNCVKECEEDWCCKKPAEAERSKTSLGLSPTGF